MREIRNTDFVGLTKDRRSVEGYAIVFNQLSNDLGGFYEIIEPTALNDIINDSTVLCVLNHNVDRGLLAKYCKGVGTLKLKIDNFGLYYQFEAPNTVLGDELLEGIKRGDITTSSFTFICGEDDWKRNENGDYIRTVKKIKGIYDVSPVYQAAYNQTTVNTRGLDILKNQEAKELEDYYKNLKSKLQ